MSPVRPALRSPLAFAGALLVLSGLLPVATAPVVMAAPDELFFSEYVEGSSNNKALEIYNGTGAAVDLAAGGYSVQMAFNGNPTPTLTMALSGAVSDGDVHVVAHASANATILAQADQTNGAGWFNGDDAVLLVKGSTVVDSIGQAGFDPGSEWGTGVTSTADNTLRRKGTISAGDADPTGPFDPSPEWDGFATDTFDGLGSHTLASGDAGPTVSSTVPAGGATNVARSANVTVTFSEPVDVSGTWFTIGCAASGAHGATVSGGPTAFVLDPTTDFAANETCTVTIVGGLVADQDAADPPNEMAADHAISFTTVDEAACGDAATSIHDIQGSGTTSPFVGQVHSVEGVVVADFQGPGQFSGYYLQEEDADADADPATSEGIFVFNTSLPVGLGDRVRIRGTVGEFVSSGRPLTQITSTSRLLCPAGGGVAATDVDLPIASLDDWERYEGMLISIDQPLTVTETFTLGRFGEVALSVGGRLDNPTAVVEPGAPAIDRQALNDRSRILLDDANNTQNLDPTRYPDGPGGLSASNTMRIGDTLAGPLTGVLEQRFGVYRIQPVDPIAQPLAFDASNPRPAAPEPVGGSLRVSAMNVLNYFDTLDLGPDICGPQANLECRGADSAAELVRQRDKIVAALVGLDADVVGLMEIENDAGEAVADLVGALNAALGAEVYAYVDTGFIGTDAIKVALIYRPAAVSPVGGHAILDSSVDPRFIDTRSRPALAQTFDQAGGGRFTVVVNHLKSKGSACLGLPLDDPDTGDGSGNCNLTRTRAAEALVDWIAGDPTGSGDRDVLVIGDLNAYAREEPIDVFLEAGYRDMIAAFEDDAYSFVFQGQSGYLDHALASPTLADQVSGATEWHVNADEPTVLDYNTEFKSPNHVNTLYASGPYRSSDHDPLVVGLDLHDVEFEGFRRPVDNPPAVNRAHAGQTIPLKFELARSLGADILADDPFSRQVDCSTGAALGPAEAAGGKGLKREGRGRYEFAWRTQRSWAGQCRQFEITFDDGTYRTALFRFRT